MTWLEILKNPPAAYRPVPFWSWNDRLEEHELRAQIRAMHEAGIDGFFMLPDRASPGRAVPL